MRELIYTSERRTCSRLSLSLYNKIAERFRANCVVIHGQCVGQLILFDKFRGIIVSISYRHLYIKFPRSISIIKPNNSVLFF